MQNWFYNFGNITLIDAAGSDRFGVLNNLCTNQVKTLTQGQGKEAFFTDVKGRTIGHGWLFETGNCLRIVCVPGQAETLIPQLDRYVIRENVQWSDLSADWHAIAVGGIGSSKLLERFNVSLSSDFLLWHAVEIEQIAVQVVQIPWTSANDLMLLVPLDNVAQIVQFLQDDNIDEISTNQWQATRINLLTPWYGIDFDTKELPQELDRDSLAISFTKGCYLGQETVARLDAMGQVQKKLRRWTIDAKPDASPLELFSGEKVVARLTSFAEQNGQTIAMGLTRRSHFEPATQATSAAGATAIRL